MVLLFLLAGNANAACREVTYQTNSYAVCEVTQTDDLRLWHSDAAGQVYGNFANIVKSLPTDQQLVFAMNAGMYHPDRAPVGLYVEGYQQKTRLIRGRSAGNFGLVPNGVFCFGDGKLAVIETLKFERTRPRCRFATQSGPMLVIDGHLHPKFRKGSSSRYIRNGVGASADGTRAVFAISNQPVNFYRFASLFRDYLGLPNALFLDGAISRIYVPQLNRTDRGFPLGPIVGLVQFRKKVP